MPSEFASIVGVDTIDTDAIRVAAPPVWFATARSAKLSASCPERSRSLSPLAGFV
ncbi:MAG: hypothetical protein OXI64_05890 [Defluviicoccus sp.]|nr:hypothetical protein [Defluviicoccus sp.]